MRYQCWKTAIVFLLVFLALICVPLSANSLPGSSSRTIPDKILSSIFPADLKVIENEAFEGTALYQTAFHDGIHYIGANAFHNIGTLSDVYVPPSVKYIGANAFPHYAFLHVVENSYAELWAKENGYSFLADYLYEDKAELQRYSVYTIVFMLFFLLSAWQENSINICQRIRYYVKSMRPQDRPELYPIDYRFP